MNIVLLVKRAIILNVMEVIFFAELCLNALSVAVVFALRLTQVEVVIQIVNFKVVVELIFEILEGEPRLIQTLNSIKHYRVQLFISNDLLVV